jgi:hypothetical protein
LHEERRRVDQYLDEATRRPLITAVETQLIVVPLNSILEKGLELVAIYFSFTESFLHCQYGLLTALVILWPIWSASLRI